MAFNYSNVSLMVISYPHIGSLSTVTSAQFALAETDAEALINAKLAQLYTVPVAGSPPILQTIATDLAVYSILLKFMTTQGNLADHPWHKRYEQAMALLDMIAGGDLPLVSSASTLIDGASSTNAPVWSNTMDYQPTFADGLSFESSHVDPDKIDDAEGDRDI